ncbi:MAG: hypothetical protein RR379_10695 [Clostridia bacterium]
MNAMLFGDTVTLYNHVHVGNVRDGADGWRRTVLHGVQVKRQTEKTVGADGVLHVVQSVRVTVPAEVDAGGRHYQEPRLYKGSGAYWTLDAQSNLDLLVLGSCLAEMSEHYTLRDLAREYGYVTVKAVSDNTRRGRLKHWKVLAV